MAQIDELSAGPITLELILGIRQARRENAISNRRTIKAPPKKPTKKVNDLVKNLSKAEIQKLLEELT